MKIKKYIPAMILSLFIGVTSWSWTVGIISMVALSIATNMEMDGDGSQHGSDSSF